jgi:integrase/recombinase XerD
MRSNKATPETKLLKEYLEFLRHYQCSAEATVVIRKMFISPFLLKLGKTARPSKLHLLTARKIHDYIISTAGPLHRASKKHLSSSMRSFLRFAYIKGYLKYDLVEAVPVITTRKLDHLPESTPWESIQKLLTMPNRGTPAGRRDYAVMLLCIHYGLRIGQVMSLKLSDIHWQDGCIYFPACKQSNALRLPLHKEVVEALLDYIKSDRQNPNFKEVFLTIRGKQRPLSRHNHYYANIRKYYLKAGITSKSQGTRQLRHAFATRLLRQKVSIKAIADLLGHRHIETTFIYTKVDFDQLRTLAREWPEVER